MFILFLFINYVYCGSPPDKSCLVDLDYSYQVDLKPLMRLDGAYEVMDEHSDSSFFRLAYGILNNQTEVFNLCGHHPKRCQNVEAAYEVLSVLGQHSDSCEIIGKPSTVKGRLLDVHEPNKGIRLFYTNGTICDESEQESDIGKERTVYFDVYCSEHQDSNFKMVPLDEKGPTRCNLGFTIRSPVGCSASIHKNQPIEFPFAILSASFLALTIGGIGLYFNKYKKLPFFNKPEEPEHKFQPLQSEDISDPEIGATDTSEANKDKIS